MIEPLIDVGSEASEGDDGDVLLRCLMARILLLRSGDVEGVLRLLGAFESSVTRQGLAPCIQAEVSLWLGWSRVWQDDEFYDDARALNLLDQASRFFCDDMNASGRCWTLIAQAQAYFTIDEYQLMLQALDEASVLQEKLNDVQAATWIAHLSVTGARFRGQYILAQRCLADLLSLAEAQDDKVSVGRAYAHEAVIAYELGEPPAKILNSAQRAERVLNEMTVSAGYSLLSAYHAHIGALLRQGSWDEAEQLVDEALARVGHLGTAKAYVSLHRARIHMNRGKFDLAQGTLETIVNGVHHKHRLLTSNVARQYSALMLLRDRPAAAQEWADRAYRNARETGHDGFQLQSLLQLAEVSAHGGNIDEARHHLRKMEPFSHYFSLLPFAAEQFFLQARLAAMRDRSGEARAFLTQALSAWSMIGNAFGVATAQYELARLLRMSAPSECRPLAEAALQTFEHLGVPKQARRLRDLLRALPGGVQDAQQLSEADIAAVLSRSALSVGLVAETWLRLAERVAPNRWMGVYQYEDTAGWRPVRVHGENANPIGFPDPHADRLCERGIDWIRLKHVSSSTFFFAMECGGDEDPACRVIENRLSAWIPVAGLAFEHALLRGSSTAGEGKFASGGQGRQTAPDGLIFASDAMRTVVEKIKRIRSSHSPVFITGESGVGKSAVAACIHQTSDRTDKPFIVVNCSNVSRESFEEQLFGPPVARSDKPDTRINGQLSSTRGIGAIREADQGTLFLDDIDNLPIELQPRLLRFLEEGEIVSPNTSLPAKVNARIIAATSQDVPELIRSGSFREDLFYRLNVIPIRVPPLRERRDEIPLFAHHFLGTLSTSRPHRTLLSGRALEAMTSYDWPGNVRQLRNEIERALVFIENEPTPLIDLDDLSETISQTTSTDRPSRELPDLLGDAALGNGLDSILASAEKAVIERALAGQDGQVSATADVLGLTRQGLYKKMKRLGIDPSRFQAAADERTGVHIRATTVRT